MKNWIKERKLIKEIGYWLIIVLILWVWGTNVVQAFKCPSMTRTQQFLHLPKTVILDFQTEPNKQNNDTYK